MTETSGYLLVMFGVVIGLGIAHVLTEVAGLIQHRKRVKFYWVQLVWAFLFLVLLINYWYVLHRWGEFGTQFHDYLLSLVYPCCLYLTVVLVLPKMISSGEMDLEAYYYEQRRWVFGLAGMGLLFITVRSSIRFDTDLLDARNLIRYSGLVLTAVLMWSDSRRVHGAITLVALALVAFFIGRFAFDFV